MKILAKKSLVTAAVLTGIMMMASGTATAASGLTEAIAGGKVSGDFRLRSETVDQGEKEASSLTLRSRLGYTTADYKGFTGFLEFENVTAMDDNYNLPTDATKPNSVVADPEGTEVNQVYMKYMMGETAIIAGRQRVILDNARFVGNVGWRQNEQTFDAVVVSSKAIADTTITYGYVDNVNTILGTELDVNAHLLNVAYTGLPGKLTGYSYMIEDEDTPSSSTSTMGLRYSGAVGEIVKFNLEYAKQGDYKEGNSDIDADYTLIEVMAKAGSINLKAGHEVLGADDVSGFETPIATKHAFNGWADSFLGTPADGLEDTYFSVSTKVMGTKLLAVYHEYSADNGGDDYGSEINLLAAKKFGKNYTALVKYADFSADSTSYTDTEKLWVMAQMKF